MPRKHQKVQSVQQDIPRITAKDGIIRRDGDEKENGNSFVRLGIVGLCFAIGVIYSILHTLNVIPWNQPDRYEQNPTHIYSSGCYFDMLYNHNGAFSSYQRWLFRVVYSKKIDTFFLPMIIFICMMTLLAIYVIINSISSPLVGHICILDTNPGYIFERCL